MTCAAALQNDTLWLELRNYDVVPLNSRLASRVDELAGALCRGVAAFPDYVRNGFYNVELPSGYAYVHIHADNRTVYLIAYSRH